MKNFSKILKMLLILAIAGIIVIYTYYKTKDFVYGPMITISYPENGTSVDKSLLEITGVAKRISYISIDDRQIFTDEDGIFKEKLLLYPGYNIISIKASDKFNRSTEKTLEVVYKEKTPYSNKEPVPKDAVSTASTTDKIILENQIN